MGAHWVLDKISSSAQLLGAFTAHCGAVPTSQAAPGDRKAWEMWLQGIGEWQIWVCRNESSKTVAAELGKYWGRGNGDRRVPGL